MLQARVKAQVLVPLLHITPHIQQGVLLVLPVTLLTRQLPALPTHSQHIHHPLETYLPHTHLSPPHFSMLFHTLTLHFQSSRQADGKPFTSSATALPAEGARDLLDTQPMARRTIFEMHSNLPLHDGFTQARFPEGFQARKNSKPSSYVSKR